MTFILEGHGLFWWAQDALGENELVPDHAVHGTIKIEDDGNVALDLDGILPSEHGPMAPLARKTLPRTKAIGGLLRDSRKRLLLFDLFPDGGSVSSNGLSYERYIASQCLVFEGSFPDVNKPLRFRELEIPLTGFEGWLRLNALHAKASKRGNVSARYTRPDNAVYSLDQGRLSIEFHFGAKSNGRIFGNDFHITQAANLHYRFTRLLDLDAIQEQCRLMEDLFVLLTGSDYAIDWPWIFSNKKLRYKFYFRRLRKAEAITAPQYFECWTNFPQVRPNFGAIWSNWVTKREFFGPGFYLYLGTRRRVQLYTEHKFVNLVWGIEALHRKKMPWLLRMLWPRKYSALLSRWNLLKIGGGCLDS